MQRSSPIRYYEEENLCFETYALIRHVIPKLGQKMSSEALNFPVQNPSEAESTLWCRASQKWSCFQLIDHLIIQANYGGNEAFPLSSSNERTR